MTVDPREQLRRYLEQRRDVGESELVLDRMSVEEVMRIVGAVGGAGGGAATGGETTRGARREPNEAAAADVPPSLARADETSAPPAAVGDAADWRTTLRASGAAPEEPMRRPPRPSESGESRRQTEAAASASPRTPSEDAAVARPRPGEEVGAAGMEQSTAHVADRGRAAEPAPAGERLSIPGVDAPVGIVVGRTTQELFAGPVSALESLDAIAATVAKCTRCPLYATATNPVPGEGNPDADLMCVGEAPGQTEDETGRPFVGAAGQLLTKILAAIKLTRDDVYIANVLKHRPPGNRNPRPDEVEACSPYLVRQVELIKPKVLIAFGTFAAQTLLETKTPIGKLRGAVHRYYGIPLVVTYHPAALLRNEAWKRPTWEDVKLARRILDSARG